MLGNFMHALITAILDDICQHCKRQVLLQFASVCGHALGTLHDVKGRRWHVVICWLLAVADVLVVLFQVRRRIVSENSVY